MTLLDVVGGRRGRNLLTGPSPDASAAFNIADVAVEHHVRDGRGGDVALRWLGRDPADLDDPIDVTFSKLSLGSSRFASALRRHGIEPGSVVATILGRVPDLYIAALGAWKARCVFSALSAASQPQPAADRLRLGRVEVLVAAPTLYRRVVAPVLDQLPDLRLVLICGASEDQTARSSLGPGAGPSVMSCGAFLRDGVDSFDIEATDPDMLATLHFTGDPSSTPTAVVHPHRAATAQNRTRVDLRAGETFWRTTDPVWVTGFADDVTAALSAGATSILDEADFDATRALHILRHQHVDVLCTSAAVLRMLRDASPRGGPLPHGLRAVGTTGEPADTATAQWAASFLGAPAQDWGSAVAHG